mmetsp:Transcript_126464/g.252687  ORF Transcript_126464/g.252687 Transcript_126464/m.252687 type:complete len:119 (-) Transcript_126464:74-430(-)
MVLCSRVVQSTGLAILAVGLLATGDCNNAGVQTWGGSNSCRPGLLTSADTGVWFCQCRSVKSKIDTEVDEMQDTAKVDGMAVVDESMEQIGEGDDAQVLDSMAVSRTTIWDWRTDVRK